MFPSSSALLFRNLADKETKRAGIVFSKIHGGICSLYHLVRNYGKIYSLQEGSFDVPLCCH